VGLQLSYAAALAVVKTGVEDPLFGTGKRLFERVIEICVSLGFHSHLAHDTCSDIDG
jgi:hypothetical protein